MADRTVLVRLKADIAQYQASMARAKQSTQQFGRELTGQGKTSQADLQGIGRTALVMSGGVALGLGLAAKSAIDWESAWAGVTKTVSGSASELLTLEAGLRQMATELPATHGEIAAVAEAAGALGISTPAIEGFTRTMIDLGETTDLTADQAATSMARIANVMQTPQTEFERMGSTLVELGNNGASTESEILELATRLAAAGQIAGLSEADIFAFSSTLASVGVEAEAGGTALSKVFVSIRDAVLDGGDQLNTFAEVAGVTAEQFASSFRDDPAAAITTFVEGLGRMNDAGQSTTGVFTELELTDQRLMRALLSTAGAGDLLTDSISTARGEWEANNALQTEAEKRYATTAAQAEMLRNKVVDLGIGIGQQLLPIVSGGVDVLSQMAQGFMSLDGPAKGALAGIAGVAGAGLGMVAAASLLVPKIQAMRAALIGMGAAGAAANAALPWLAAAAAAVGVVSYALGQNAQQAAEAEARIKSWAEAIRGAGSVAEGTEAKLSELATENADLANAIDQSEISLSEWASALSGSDADFNRFIGQLEDAAAAGTDFGVPIEMLTGQILPRMRSEMQLGATEAGTLNRVLGDTSPAGADAAGGIDQVTGAMEEAGGATESATEALKKHQDALRAQLDPIFGMMSASADNAAAQQELTEAFALNSDAIADNDVSLQELDAMHQRAAESALDLDFAAETLAGSIESGVMPVETFRAKLDDWVASGRISQDTANNLAWRVGVLTDKSEGYAGSYVGRFEARDYASGTIQHVNRQLDALDGRRITVIIAGQVLGGDKKFMPQLRSAGGLIHRSTGGPVYWGDGGTVGPLYRATGGDGPKGTDTVPAWLTPGEYVINASAVSAIGLPALNALNGMSSGGGVTGMGGNFSQAGGGTTTFVDQSQHFTINASSIDAHHVGREIRDAVVTAGRRGIAA